DALTQTGVVAGTPQYMSPEQAWGAPLDHRADLFSLGSVLYALCTGQAPFRAGSTMGVLRRVCEESPPPVRAVNPSVPAWLAEVIEALHAKDPADRIQSAGEVVRLLDGHLRPARVRRRGRWALLLAALLVAGLAAWLAFWLGGNAAGPESALVGDWTA